MSKIGVPDTDKEAKDVIVFGFLTYWFIKEVSGASTWPVNIISSGVPKPQSLK